MKPNFALSLSLDGIALLFRARDGWRLLGDVALDSPDLNGELAALRKRAAELCDGPVFCKIVVPNDQVRYMTIDTGTVGEMRRVALVESALEGATPYELDELAYAWAPAGDSTQVAAVARETLDEAEGFATTHGFAPVAFVARPDRSKFAGEPYFGEANAASRSLPPGEVVERDLLAISVVGPLGDEDGAGQELPPEAPDGGGLTFAKITAGEVVDPHPEEPEPATPPAMPHLGRRDPRPADTAPGADGAPGNAHEARRLARFSLQASAPDLEEPEISFTSIRARRVEDETDTGHAAPPLMGVSRDEPVNVSARRVATFSGDRPTPPFPGAPVAADDPARKVAPPVDADPATPEEEAPAPASAQADEPARPVEFVPVEFDDDDETPDETGQEEDHATDEDAEEEVSTERLIARIAMRQRGAAHDEIPEGRRERAGLGAAISRLKAPRREDGTPRPMAAPAADLSSREAEAARMTVFGARPSQVVERPQFLGGLLSLILVLFIGGAAAWSSIFMSEDVVAMLRTEPESRTASALPQPAPVPAPAEEPDETADAAFAALEVPSEPAPREALPQPVERAPLRQLDPVTRPRSVPPVLAEPDAETEARYAATGVWIEPPDIAPSPYPGTVEDIYVASIDPAVPNLDAIALPVPEAQRADRPLATQMDPAPAGTEYELDDRGYVVATPDGTLNPDGIPIIAGEPARVPPSRPAETREESVREIVAALSAKRPRLRPEGLVERNERLRLGGYSRTELAAIRPRLRPALSEERREAETPPETTDETGTEVAEEDDDGPDATETGTAFAIASSPRPSARPGGFSSTVAAAEAAAIRPVAVVAPRESVAPDIPSSASVTRQATVRSAINLRQINLIGVYGQPADRRALVRMSDGRYRKVQVGDRIDGGRISAIGDGELRYVKGGRNHILRMPQG
ncbi:MAG: hypothetical protein ACU0DK_02095 [Pseudooceanicola sp.]